MATRAKPGPRTPAKPAAKPPAKPPARPPATPPAKPPAKPEPKAPPRPAPKPPGKPPSSAPAKRPPEPAATDKPRPAPRVAFPKKAHPPTHAEFAARLPAPLGKRFESLRAFLVKRGAREDLYYYGPRTGWAYRYLVGERSLCSIVVQRGFLVGIVALDAGAQAKVGWTELSEVARRARRMAHGTPALLWLDVPLDASGANDFKALLKAKLAPV